MPLGRHLQERSGISSARQYFSYNVCRLHVTLQGLLVSSLRPASRRHRSVMDSKTQDAHAAYENSTITFEWTLRGLKSLFDAR